MPGFSAAVDRLTAALGRLPGIGAKSAERLAHHLLKCSPEEAIELAEAIRVGQGANPALPSLLSSHRNGRARLRDLPRPAPRPGTRLRGRTVSRPARLEKAATFQGVYHVLLGRLLPCRAWVLSS